MWLRQADRARKPQPSLPRTLGHAVHLRRPGPVRVLELLFGVSGGRLRKLRVVGLFGRSDLLLGFLPLGAAGGEEVATVLRLAPRVESRLYVLHLHLPFIAGFRLGTA